MVKEGLLEEGHLTEDLHVDKESVLGPVEEMDVPDRGKSECKGHKVKITLTCLIKANVAGEK